MRIIYVIRYWKPTAKVWAGFLGGALSLFFLCEPLVIFQLHRARASEIPTIDSVTISNTSYGSAASSITLTENQTTTVYIHGTASDADWCEDIDATSNYSLVLYRTDVGSACSADNNDCYRASAATTVDECTPGGSDPSARYQFEVNLEYYTDPTDAGSPNAGTNWTAQVTVTDDQSDSGSGTATTEVASLIALSVTAAIDYGSVALGGTSSEQTVTLTNTGNRNMDATVQGSGSMSCTVIGSVAVGSAHYSLSQGFAFGDGAAVTTSTVNVNNGTAQRTNDATASTTPVYFLLQLPATGVSGTCTNTLTFTAQADA